MKLRVAAFALGAVAGFGFGWARLTDPDTFHRMLALRSADIYLLMATAVAVAFVGARLLRGRRALLTGERVAWHGTPVTRDHVLGSALFGAGWAVSSACPGPTIAQLGAGRVLAAAVAAGIITGVWLQPHLARRPRRAPTRIADARLRRADVL